MRIGYLDCYSGLSGDMILGALLDCGLPLQSLTAELDKLELKDCRVTAQQARRGVITGTQVTVEAGSDTAERRTLRDIAALIHRSALSDSVKERSTHVFQRLAEAESRVHRVPIEEVHFHELGAVDTIVDIVGAFVGLDLLAVEALYSAPLPNGGGTVECQHGTLPVPSPATLELIASAAAPVRPSTSPEVGELVTPTGAAIVTTVASFQTPTFAVNRVGYGVGSRELPSMPNVLPLWLGQSTEERRPMALLETNIDDMTPEIQGYVLESLLERGALDVWFTPIHMKKNRPAVMLSVLCTPEAEADMVEMIARETSTLGVRLQRVERHEFEREEMSFHSSLGDVRVKLKRLRGERIGLSPEFEDCRCLALEHGLPLQEVYRTVMSEASARFMGR
ncbi:MAG: nickel pincer cofactor biosynthesis protein LarC [Chloroflexota bacterium]|nr:nickel pincer cofactor biosynthesis protein LarC [Chloroflexota bacterium]